MMNKVCLLLLGVTLLNCSGQKILFETDPQYLTEVPLLYQLGAYSSVRSQNAVLSFYDADHAKFKNHGIVTILDEEHRDKGVFKLFYDQFRKVDYLNVQLRNKDGVVVGTYTINEADDYSASGSNFFSDVRVKYLETYYHSYPYTIEYEYQYSYSGTLNLHDWYPGSYEQSLIKASFEIRDYTNGSLRYHARNLDQEPKITEHEDYLSTSWELTGQLAQGKEMYSPPYTEVFPNVVTSASRFQISNSTGSAESWESFGSWYHELGKGKRVLPKAAIKEIDLVLQSAASEKEKVIALYTYLQNKTRYVSIQLGLGGWEPYSADFVFKKKYGDCKALVNFMQAMLEYAEIKAEPVLIRNGIRSPKVIADFPSSQFNHVILRVTLSNGETIWLECTSKYIKPGRIGAGNEGKYALLVNKDGSKIIQTEISEANENQTARVAVMTLNEDGSALIKNSVKNTGVMEDELLYQLNPVSPKKRVEWLEDSIPMDDFNLISYSFNGLKKGEEETGYSFELRTNNYASVTTKRIFVPINEMNRWNVNIPDNELRVNSLHLPFKFAEIDSLVYELPPGYAFESIPNDTKIETKFGSYSLTHEKNEDKITFNRNLIISKTNIPKEEYEAFKEFFSTVNSTDRAQFVVVKKR